MNALIYTAFGFVLGVIAATRYREKISLYARKLRRTTKEDGVL